MLVLFLNQIFFVQFFTKFVVGQEIIPCTENNGFYECESGKCIPVQWLCDSAKDCPDGDDELHSNCGSAEDRGNCEPFHFACIDQHSGRQKCVRQEWRCDGFIDCKNGIDEENCEVRPEPLQSLFGQQTPPPSRPNSSEEDFGLRVQSPITFNLSQDFRMNPVMPITKIAADPFTNELVKNFTLIVNKTAENSKSKQSMIVPMPMPSPTGPFILFTLAGIPITTPSTTMSTKLPPTTPLPTQMTSKIVPVFVTAKKMDAVVAQMESTTIRPFIKPVFATAKQLEDPTLKPFVKPLNAPFEYTSPTTVLMSSTLPSTTTSTTTTSTSTSTTTTTTPLTTTATKKEMIVNPLQIPPLKTMATSSLSTSTTMATVDPDIPSSIHISPSADKSAEIRDTAKIQEQNVASASVGNHLEPVKAEIGNKIVPVKSFQVLIPLDALKDTKMGAKHETMKNEKMDAKSEVENKQSTRFPSTQYANNDEKVLNIRNVRN